MDVMVVGRGYGTVQSGWFANIIASMNPWRLYLQCTSFLSP